MNPKDVALMRLAIEQAGMALECGEVPVGAVIAQNGRPIAFAHNTRERDANALAHAEILAIDRACKALGRWRLDDCDMFVTLEPCPMCCGALINARIRRVVYALREPKTGCCGSVINLFEMPFYHRPDLLSGVCAAESANLMETFFQRLRTRDRYTER